MRALVFLLFAVVENWRPYAVTFPIHPIWIRWNFVSLLTLQNRLSWILLMRLFLFLLSNLWENEINLQMLPIHGYSLGWISRHNFFLLYFGFCKSISSPQQTKSFTSSLINNRTLNISFFFFGVISFSLPLAFWCNYRIIKMMKKKN